MRPKKYGVCQNQKVLVQHVERDDDKGKKDSFHYAIPLREVI